MFLALREIRYEKFRYSLIMLVISLISFLIFIITGLALGLANQNTEAIKAWQTQQALMATDANGNMGQSLMTKSALNAYPKKNNQAKVGITPTTLKTDNKHESVQYIGLKPNEYIYQNLQIVAGHKPQHSNEIVISDQLKDFTLNDQVQLGLDQTTYKIVGKAKHAQYNIAPVVYGQLKNWAPIKGVSPDYGGSGIISRSKATLKTKHHDEKSYSKQAFLKNLPGYTAQNTTFIFVIGFLILISLIIITIFLYILTLQKLNNLAVLRAQGVPNRYLVQNTLTETVLMMVVGISIGGLFAAISAYTLPDSVPLYFDFKLTFGATLGLFITGLIGALIPMRMITKIDPVSAIGG